MPTIWHASLCQALVVQPLFNTDGLVYYHETTSSVPPWLAADSAPHTARGPRPSVHRNQSASTHGIDQCTKGLLVPQTCIGGRGLDGRMEGGVL